MKEVTVEGIYGFSGLYLYRSLYKLNTLSVNNLFCNDFGPLIFSATMSRNRFISIHFHLSFDDKTARENRWQHDRFEAMREGLKFSTLSVCPT